jgi:hypothetical protein
MDPITIVTALNLLSIALDIAQKAKQVLITGDPASIEDELKRLDAARLRPSAEIVTEADRASGTV